MSRTRVSIDFRARLAQLTWALGLPSRIQEEPEGMAAVIGNYLPLM